MSHAPRHQLHAAIESNERTIAGFYRLIALLLISVLVAHLAYASFMAWSTRDASTNQVILFGIFNGSALVIEVYLSRIAFMLGSRAGQLKDVRYCIDIADSDIDVARLQAAAQAVMSTRREEAGLKILDVEAIASGVGAKLAGAKGEAKGAA